MNIPISKRRTSRVELLFDENLSPRLVNRLSQLFPGLRHVREVGRNRANDQQIWNWARDNAFAIITADSNDPAGLLSLRFTPRAESL